MRTLGPCDDVCGQQINIHKSSIFQHPKVGIRREDRAKLIAGMKEEAFPINYLGCPLYTRRKKISTFSIIIEKILNRIKRTQQIEDIEHEFYNGYTARTLWNHFS
ncbi:hypothetical protein HAX54_015383 [Datura stramonium]|uniref:Uncharacterized protein n=1 Tax=Datura stramonium TaxID=4076 RepID=A0ABS8TPQ3_DATST|nr:hypothetical protein [Datura stramonium]